MKKNKIKKIYWGIVLIAIAVFVLLECFGVNIGFIGELPLLDVILAAIILSIAVVSVIDMNVWAVPFELAVIFMLFESEIAASMGRTESNIINNWLLLGCALLVSIGISLIINPFRYRKFSFVHNDSANKFTKENFRTCKDGKHVRFSSETKYIDCTTFENFYYSIKMGDGNIFFENIGNYKGGGVLNVECKMGNMTVHVPRDWHIVTNIESSMGNVEVDGAGNSEGPEITIQGICNMGNIEIIYC